MKQIPTDIPITERLAALSDRTRLRIARLLEQHELSVGEVASSLQLPQSTVSRHLKALNAACWVTKRPLGPATYYSLTQDDLPPQARQVWVAVREELNPKEDFELAEDDRRAVAVVDSRKLDSRVFFGHYAGEWDALRRELFGEHFTALGLLALIDPSWTIADFGCGTGNATELLAPYVDRVYAIDQSGPMLEAARKRLSNVENVEFIVGSIEDCPLEHGTADASVMVLVMHHIEDPTNAIREMSRVTKPGGMVTVIDMHQHKRTEFRRNMGHHHLGFAEEEVAEYFVGAGLPEPRIRTLPGPPDAKGPGLFVATARADTST